MAKQTTTWKWNLLILGIVSTCHIMAVPRHIRTGDEADLDAMKTELVAQSSEMQKLLESLYYRAGQAHSGTLHSTLVSKRLYGYLQPVENNVLEDNSKKRSKRNVNFTEPQVSNMRPNSVETGAEMAVPEQQTINGPSQLIAHRWRQQMKIPDFKAKNKRYENVSDAKASMMVKEGLTSRAPKVNFITQQTKPSDQSTEVEHDLSEQIIRESYRRIMAKRFDTRRPKNYESFIVPPHSQLPMVSQMYGKYNDFHREMMDGMHPPSPHRYDQFYQRRYDVDYDPYYPRYEFPYFYYYPDKRYDTPFDYRDRKIAFANDIANSNFPINPIYRGSLLPMSLPTSFGPVMRNRRIIYYTTLPEIVRTPTNRDLRFYNHYRNPYESVYSTNKPPVLSTYNEQRILNNYLHKEDKQVISTPIKVVRDVGIPQNTQNEQPELRIVRRGKTLDSDRNVFRNNR